MSPFAADVVSLGTFLTALPQSMPAWIRQAAGTAAAGPSPMMPTWGLAMTRSSWHLCRP